MITVSWSPREVPLAIDGAVAVGDVARRWARRLLADPPQGVVTDDALVVLGPEVPWVDGLVYIGREPGVPGLWMDTRLSPSVPADLLRRTRPGPFVWLPDRRIDVTAVDRFDADHLRAWAGL